MSGRVALVTGAGRGIGAAIATRLAAEGHAVAVNYAANEAAAASVVSAIVGAGGAACALRADVSDPDAVTRLVDATAAQLGPIDVLVNNAGVNLHGAARRVSLDDWQRSIGVNLSGPFHCIRAVLPSMYERGFGRIVNIGSAAGGRTSLAGTSAYSASKAGLAALARVIAVETAGRGITINTVVPGLVETDLIASAHDGAVASTRATWPSIPAEAVADLVSYLVSDRAAHVSGEDIAVWLGGPRS